MMYCPKCGISLPDDATECDACGSHFEPMTDTPKAEKKTAKSPDVKAAFRKWAQDQGMFCLIAKAVAVVVMVFYLLTAIVYTVSLIIAKSPGGHVFSAFFQHVLTGLAYGVIIWLLSDAVLYLQKLYEMKKKETKDK